MNTITIVNIITGVCPAREGESSVITMRQASIHSTILNVRSANFPTQKYTFVFSNVPIKNSKCLSIQE